MSRTARSSTGPSSWHPRRAKYLSYFDPVEEANTAEAAVALAQFANKKPCWTDQLSPSGYVVPLGMLKQAGVRDA